MIGISTKRLTLQPFAHHDAAETFAAITPHLARFMDWEPPQSLEEFAAIWRSWLPAMEAGAEFYFVIRADEGFVGLAGLHDLKGDLPELGIWVRETAQRCGYGHEAMAALVGWASRRFGPAAFRWPVAVDNVPSRRLAQKLGGVLVGRLDRPKYAGVLYRVPAEIPSS